MAYTSISEIDNVYSAQEKHKDVAKHSTAQQRKKLLERLLAEIRSNEDAIQKALYHDFHKSAMETAITEIFAVEFELKQFIKHVEKWAKGKSVSRSLLFPNVSASLHYEPKGQVLIITPWNYPFQLPLVHLVASIAAGNVTMLKLSEFSKHTNQVIKKILGGIFKEEHVAVIEGEVNETTHLLTKRFDHIHFTGSPAVGKIVMKAASANLSDITLELGGKSPAIFDKNVSLERAVKNIIWAKFVNAGQTCIAPDYLLVPRPLKSEIEQLFKKELEHAFGTNAQHSPDFARIINDKQYKRLSDALTDARSLGAQLIAGGNLDERERYIEPTVLSNVAENNPLMTDEIFGPILPIVYYNQIADAISFINKKEKPLALYIFSEDSKFSNHVIRHTSAGSTCVNDAMIQILHPSLPFGGVNNSGIGQSTGWYGFKSFSHERAIADVKLMPMSKMFWFPYTEKTFKLLKWMKKLI